MDAGLFDECLTHNEDFDCFLRVLRDWPLAIVGRRLVEIRLRQGSASCNPLSMHLSLIAVIDRTRARPERYPPAITQAYQPALGRALGRAGDIFLERGETREARALFARQFRLRPSPRTAWRWTRTWLDRRAARTA